MGPEAWPGVVAEAISADDPTRSPHRLAELLLTCAPQISRPTDATRIPRSSPSRDTTRRAARALLGWTDRLPEHAAQPAWRVLALMFLVAKPRRGEDGSLAEVASQLAAAREATAVATESGDEELWCIAALRLCRVLRDSHENVECYDLSLQVQHVLDRLPEPEPGPLACLGLATGDAPGLAPATQERLVLRYSAHTWAARSARMLRRYPDVIRERDLQIAVARRLTDAHPAYLADALGQRAAVARALGDVSTALALLEEQRRYAEASGRSNVMRTHLRSRSATASSFDDWAEAQAARKVKLALLLTDRLPEAGLSPTVSGALEAVTRLRGAVGDLRTLGNDAYELAYLLALSGATTEDPATRTEARGWLDVAAAAWEDIMLNGAIAIEFRRLELDALDGLAGSPQDIGRRMVGLSRAWIRANGQRRAAVEACRWGAPGDPVVRARLDELLTDDVPPVDRAYLDRGLAEWHLKDGDRAAAEGDSAAGIAAWRLAAEHAAASAAGLTVDRPDGTPVLLSAYSVVEAYQTQAAALSRLWRSGITAVSRADELAVRVAALPAVAQRMTASGALEQRGRVERAYRPWLAETADLACDIGDHRGADATLEVARRDLVGTVLCALATDPESPEQVAGLARRITAALSLTVQEAGDNADPTGVAAADDGDQAPDPVERGSLDRAMARGVGQQLDETFDVVGTVLGPMARTLFDPRTVAANRGADALAAIAQGSGPAAVLSLWLVSDSQARLVRRLTWTSGEGDGVHEHLDVVQAPPWLGELEIGDDADLFFSRVETLTDVLLPGPLLDLLAAADQDHPIRLAVVPTGVLVVPFAVLPVGASLRLLDVAITSCAQSLQAIVALAGDRGSGGDDAPVQVAVYDTVQLPFAGHERDELLRLWPSVRSASSLADLTVLLSEPARRGALGVFAMAVHGSRGRDGWGQVKQLPNGEPLTAGHVLQWYLPRLVVGASCNTDIREDAGGELGGFPLAFQLRGAVTVIGTLHYVEDEATGQMMGLFYAAVAAGHEPAAALRVAQRSWIAGDRAQRYPALHRWAYLLTYGLPG